MRKELASGLRVELKLRRPKVFPICIAKEGKSLGLTLNYITDGVTMSVKGIKDGAAKDCRADLQAGDRILSVNDQIGVEKMLAELRDSASPKLVVSRAAPKAPSSLMF
mmetsp:Transcript_42472/g.122826  ORF Transcript_42472/g.122826 Transcript_42472/m.122826 type:complete len:108 (+) Transcript_42472:97-420(+)